jgi:AcrR family transcriptional regulator
MTDTYTQPTFDKLNAGKQAQIRETAMREFAVHSYEEASINRIVMAAGIAKGSIYQYFGGKQSLYLYLVDYAARMKKDFVAVIKEQNSPDFWPWLQACYLHGLHFDMQYPHYTGLLHRFSEEKAVPEVRMMMEQHEQAAFDFFYGKLSQSYDNRIPATRIELTTFMIVQSGRSLLKYVARHYHIDFEQNVREGKPVLGVAPEELEMLAEQVVHSLRYGIEE